MRARPARPPRAAVDEPPVGPHPRRPQQPTRGRAQLRQVRSRPPAGPAGVTPDGPFRSNSSSRGNVMSRDPDPTCPDCDPDGLDRRGFLASLSTTAAAAAFGGRCGPPRGPPPPRAQKSAAETAVKALYDTLTDKQKKTICFDWDYKHPGARPAADARLQHLAHHRADADQRLLHQGPAGHPVRHLQGRVQPRLARAVRSSSSRTTTTASRGARGLSFAIFGKPGTDKFEFVMTGRHMTIRADGNSAAHVALGGPIFHGHAAGRLHREGRTTPATSSGTRRSWPTRSTRSSTASSRSRPWSSSGRKDEFTVAFQGAEGKLAGMPCSELSRDQKEGVQKVLTSLIEPYRKEDRDEVLACLKKQGGLDKCCAGLLQGRRHRQRRRVGQLAAGGAGVRLVLPRPAARPHLDQRGRRPVGPAEREELLRAGRRRQPVPFARAPRARWPGPAG